MTDERSGIYGAFAVRFPLGKILGCLGVMASLFLCLVVTKWLVGGVGWLEKGVYVKASWDGMMGGLRRTHGTSYGRYLIAVEAERKGMLYTDAALAAGRRAVWLVVHVDPAGMRSLLETSVYSGRLGRHTAWLWLGFPVLAIFSVVGGQQVDMARLRRARHAGVWIRGNRLVDQQEWNRRAGRAG